MRHLLRAALMIPLLASFVLAESIADYVSAELSVNRKEVYIGEAFEIFLTVRSHTVTLGQDFSLDSLGGESVRKLSENFSHYPVEKQLKNDRIEETRRFSWQVVGIATGSLELASVLDISVLSRSTDLFFSRPKKTYFKIPAEKTTISIRPLPAKGRPDNFSGAVGSFTLSVEVSPEAAAPGDVVRLRSEIRGTGLLENVSAPLLTDTTGLKLYSPKRISSSPPLVYEQQVIPLTAEALTLPTISFSFFDPNAEIYRTVSEGPFRLKRRSKSVSLDRAFRPSDATPTPAHVILPGTPLSFRNASIGLAVLILLLAATLVRSGQRNKITTLAMIAGLGILLVAGTTYLIVLRSGYFQRDVYRVESRQKGMAAPAESALQITVVPTGAYVEQLTCSSGWVLINHSGRQAWIPESALTTP